jgi:agmatine deiminase
MTLTLDSTPLADGFRMPAEFEPHAGCWMLWPERPDVWRMGARPAQAAFAAVAATIARYEPVTMGVTARQFEAARAVLPSQVRLVEIPADDAWMRDVGPTFVVDDRGNVRGVDWDFNAWGGLYSSWEQDRQVAQKVLETEGFDRYSAGNFILEGGSIHVDGQGTLLTTEQCLLNPDRNPGFSRADIESRLREYLNVETIIWLGCGVVDDETSGHVDNLCCFVRPGVVALTWTDDRDDPQYEFSHEAYERLAVTVDARGRRLTIHKIHQPNPLYITEQESQGVEAVAGTHPRRTGDRLAGSYLNFYIANGLVLAPQFSDPHDGAALEALRGVFPDRVVLGLPAREVLLGGGGIHCITLQQPAPASLAGLGLELPS